MTLFNFLIAIMTLWAVREIVVGLFVWLSRRRVRQSLRVERTQSQFADARNELMRLVHNGNIDTHSVTFGFFYSINTLIMRRPDEYREISAALRATFLNPSTSERNNALQEESKHWTKEIKNAVQLTAKAMDYIILEYSWPLRCLYRIRKRTDPTLTPRRWLSGIARRIEETQEKKPVVLEIRQTQEKMHNLCTV